MKVPEAELLQGNPLDLRQLLLGQLVLEAVAGEEVEADARGHAACPTLPLQGVGPGHPRVLQALHAPGRVVPNGEGGSDRFGPHGDGEMRSLLTGWVGGRWALPFLLHLAGVDDVHHVVDGHGRLGDVGGDDDLGDALGGPAENRLLLLIGQCGMQRVHHAPRRRPGGGAGVNIFWDWSFIFS